VILTDRLLSRMLHLWGALAHRRLRGFKTRRLLECALLPEAPMQPPVKRMVRMDLKRKKRRRR
jgi:hypothetical protein